jgi:endo-1,3-1,4-beta-glycanase ExoK
MRGVSIAALCIAAIAPATAAHASTQSGAREFFSNFSKLDNEHWYVSDGWANGAYQSCEWSRGALATPDGALAMRLARHGARSRDYSCAEIRTPDHYGYGLYEARIRAAAGSGLVTAFFTYVGPGVGASQWDEIDFEILGKDTSAVQINYFADGEGRHEVRVPLGFDAARSYHDYAIEWTPDHVRWYVDGKAIYETPAGARLPNMAGQLFFSLWSGSHEESAWLGPMDYQKPATAKIAWAAFTPEGRSCAFSQSLTCSREQYPEI